MSSLTAAILRLKLGHHPHWTARRVAIAARYDAVLSEGPAEVLRWPDPVRHVYHKYVFLTDRRAELETHLKCAGVPTKRHYDTPLPREGVFASHVPENARWPVAEDMAARALSLPIYAQLTDDELAHIVRALRSFFA
jgi:dTDP-4-amino-4,6-dideoxygalactose transaminase